MAGHGSGRLSQLEPLDGRGVETGQGRLRWSCVVPTMRLDEAVVQMREAKTNGAVAVCMRPLEGDRLLTNRYFYPIYEEASRLDMAIAIHIANANPANCDLWRTAPGAAGLFSSGFQIFRGPTVVACHVLLMSELPHVFPTLRWGLSRPPRSGCHGFTMKPAAATRQPGERFPTMCSARTGSM